MPSKLCPHVTLAHYDAPRDERIIRDWRPVAVKLMWPHGPHPYLHLFRDVPLIVMREWALSEEKDFHTTASAVTRGHVHAERCRLMWEHVKGQGFGNPAQFAWEGLNEPWEVPAPLLDDYYAAFLARLREYGLRGVALNYGVGWPANSGPDTPVDWTPYGQVHAELKRGGHLLGLHEYWAHESVKDLHDNGQGGRMGGWRWEAGRYLQCPWDVPIVITETGIDEGVVPGQPNHGWRTFYEHEPQRYVAQLAEYDTEIRKDKRIVAAFIFTHDTNDRKWQPFDTRHDGFLAVFVPYLRSLDNTPDPTPEPPPTPQPTPAPAWLHDVADTLPKHPTKRYPVRTRPVTHIVVHHSASSRDGTTPEAIARYHIGLGWAGAGYNIIITGDGVAYLANPLNIQGNHVGNWNDRCIGICWTGLFTPGAETPSAAQLATGRKVLTWVYGQTGLGPANVLGHRDVPGASTKCPGSDWWREMLAEQGGIDWTAVRWSAEQAAREARDGMGQQAHDRLVRDVVPPLYALEGAAPGPAAFLPSVRVG